MAEKDTQLSKHLLRAIRHRENGTETRLEYANYNDAGNRLKIAHIMERESELGALAFEYVANGQLQKRIGNISDREREIGLSFARYAVSGRTDEE